MNALLVSTPPRLGRWLRIGLMWLGALCCGPALRADDTEIFLGSADPDDLRPHLVIVIDSGPSMATRVGRGDLTRLDVARQLLFGLLDTVADVKVGLAFRDEDGEPVLLPPQDPDGPAAQPQGAGAANFEAGCDPGDRGDCTAREQLRAALRALRPGGAPGIANLTDIAARLLLPEAQTSAGEDAQDTSCAPQKHLLVLTDGETRTAVAPPPRTPTGELRMHTVDLGRGSDWLEDLAADRGGVYRSLEDILDLPAGVEAIASDLLGGATTFTGPLPVVDHFTRMNHGDGVYFAVFEPNRLPRWRGNLKRYALAERGTLIVDADGRAAIDEETGGFSAQARSFWSASPDGAAIGRGGAAARLPSHAVRKVYTYLPESTSRRLSHPVNALLPGNAALEAAYFGAASMSVAALAGHIEWIRGRDVDDEDGDGNTSENRHAFGDPLHSRPAAARYGGPEAEPDVEVFIGTNGGSLHAINGRTGVESFAFFPAVTLPMQRTLRANLSGTPRPYGMDGTPTLWRNDATNDGIDARDPRDFVRLYTGMRRGGRNYYALDVTDRSNPLILWQIEGGTQGVLGDFRELGQTWSQPIKTRIRIADDPAPRDVLLFSAGYDPAQDGTRRRTPASRGRGMYIVDALTGVLLWSGGQAGAQRWTRSFPGMEYAFPATPAVIDVSGDGLADMWFAGDTGGQLWRFDIHNGEPVGELVTGGVIGDLGVAGSPDDVASNRRFFASPSVALTRGPDGPELAVAIGSGFRPSPLSVLAQNRVYLLRQRDVFAAPSTYRAVSETELRDVTDDVVGQPGSALSVSAPAGPTRPSRQGWFFDLPGVGEKVLSSPLIVDDHVLFTSYTPGSGGGRCHPAAGISRAYRVRLDDGRRPAPQRLLTTSLVDTPVLVVSPATGPSSDGSTGDAVDTREHDADSGSTVPDPTAAGHCSQGSMVSIRLNAEEHVSARWCNVPRPTYWVREQ